MGKLLQENNRDKIVIIAWNFGNIDPEYGPLFYFFESTADILNHLTHAFITPFIPANPKNLRYTEKNALISFNSDDLMIIITSYKSDGMSFVFFDSNRYSDLVQLLSPHILI